ncbi:MerR family transcriptional regulator [Actinomadura rupiterrae]|uniref:MerR family transcriptional regulator n=1 Tax=Actinomadura rupiterrae TaxID=559627 RepID=UPI0020A262D3|nr:MerR family transcriptional regulator [Actinomadura rupiterrae]MCP2337566.1 DNA-binding transcriptional MerR regulator [Actinomadura rupiterrae]
MATYRVDDLAHAAGTTARHVRVFRERGVLHPPRREGRIAVYDETHLARLRLIGQLQERGHTIATIAELLTAWEKGHDLADVLGVEKALTDPWTTEPPERISAAELSGMFFPRHTPDDLSALPPAYLRDVTERAEQLGFIRRDGDGFVVPNPTLLQVGAELIAAGVPLTTVFDIAAETDAACQDIAERFVQLAVDRGNLEDPAHYTDRQDLPRVADLIQRLRPLSEKAVTALLARAMEAEIQARTSAQLTQIADRTTP